MKQPQKRLSVCYPMNEHKFNINKSIKRITPLQIEWIFVGRFDFASVSLVHIIIFLYYYFILKIMSNAYVVLIFNWSLKMLARRISTKPRTRSTRERYIWYISLRNEEFSVYWKRKETNFSLVIEKNWDKLTKFSVMWDK